MLGLKKIVPTLGFVVMLSACGGGGGEASSAAVSTSQSSSSNNGSNINSSAASFKVRSVFEGLFAMPVGGVSSFDGGAGVRVQFTSKEDVRFEGTPARRTEFSIHWASKEVSSPEDKVQRISFFVGGTPSQFLGVHNESTAGYEVASAGWDLPDTAKIGTSGPFGESKVYSDAGKTQLLANARVDYSVEAEPAEPTSAWMCLTFTERDPVRNVRTDVTRLCGLVADSDLTAKTFKMEVDDLDSNGNSLGRVRVF